MSLRWEGPLPPPCRGGPPVCPSRCSCCLLFASAQPGSFLTHTHTHATQLFEPPPCGRAQRFELARAWNVPPRRTAAAATPAAATVQYPAWSRRSPHASAAANGMPCQHTWPVVGVLTASTWPAGSPLTGVQARMAPPPPPFPRLALAQGIQACCRAAAVAAAHPLCHPSPAAVPPPAAPAPPAIA